MRPTPFDTCRRRLRAVILGLAMAIGGATPQVHAEATEPLTFSLAEVPPWAYEDDQGGSAGLLVELVEKLRDRTGLPMEYSVRPHARAALELNEGTADFAPYFDSPTANRAGEPVAELVRVRYLVVGFPGQPTVESLSDLDGQNVGYLSGTWYGEAFRDHEGFNKVEVSDVSHGVRLMRAGRLTALVASDVAIGGEYSPDGDGNGLQELMKLGTGVGRIYQSRASDRTDAVPAIQSAMSEMAEDGTLEALFGDRYEPGGASGE